MRFGKPVLTAEPPAPTPEPVPVTRVKAEMRNHMEWTWNFYGEARNETAMALLAALTGPPDANGWIRDNDGDWAYRADEIRGVTLRYATESPKDAA